MQAVEAMCYPLGCSDQHRLQSITANDTWPKSNKAETLNVPKLQEIAQNHWPFTLQAIKAKEKWKSQKEFSRWKEIEEIR